MSQDRRLFREAADLAIRLQNDPGNPVAVETVRAWVARGPEYAAAWQRVAAIHGMSGKVLSQERKSGERASLSRRGFMVGGLVALGAAAGAWGIPQALLLAQADHLTATAEIRHIGLPDGSTVTLGPDSAVTVDHTDTSRSVRLLAGMAFFEVSPDPSRPFSVRSGDITATALGTAFDMSNDAGFVSLSVEEGLVEVVGSRIVPDRQERLSGGEWIRFDPSSVVARGERDAFEVASWRTGMIVAENETVSALVAKISRWHSGRVVIADMDLGSRLVSGVFDLTDPAGALEAVIRPFGARMRTMPFLTVISAA